MRHLLHLIWFIFICTSECKEGDPITQDPRFEPNAMPPTEYRDMGRLRFIPYRIWSPWDPVGGTTQNDAYNLLESIYQPQDSAQRPNMMREIFREFNHKSHQTDSIVQNYQGQTPFQYGFIIGSIKSQYAKMMAHYRELWDRLRGRTIYMGYQIKTMDDYVILINWEWMHLIEIDIERVVEKLEEVQDSELQMYSLDKSVMMKDMMKNRMMRTGPQKEVTEKQLDEKVLENKLRSGQQKEDVTDEDKEVLKEAENLRKQEQYKRQLRHEYLMKALGLPANHTTTKKRFWKKWPVEGSWDFGPDGLPNPDSQ